MRTPTLFLLLGITACAGTEFAPPDGGGGEQVALVAISGRVVDSVTARSVPGVKVNLGGKIEVTDVDGIFRTTVPSDSVSVSVSTIGFEKYARIIRPSASIPMIVALRRLAPIPVSCVLHDTVFVAVVVDLQGRKSLERWSQSTLTLVSAGRSTTIGALHWGYRPLDTYRWEVDIVGVDPALARIDWDLYDSEGHAYRGSCEPAAPPPEID
ncbi:MAG: hypothetical protein ABJB33_01735 [Gemmatimonadota bacterium]